MPLTKLHIKTFKGHEDLTVDFSERMNVITGKNFSGKTRVLEAVSYALFGPSSVPGGAKEARTWGSRRRPAVVLHKTTGGDEYVITRAGSSAKLEKNGELEASGQASVTKAVEKLLGLDAKTHRLLRTSPQDESQAILTLGSAKLGAMVNEITRVDVIDQVIARAKAEIDATGAFPESVDIAPLQEEQDKLGAWLTLAHPGLTDLQASYDEVIDTHHACTLAMDDLIHRQGDALRQAEGLAQTRARLEQANAELDRIGVVAATIETTAMTEKVTRLQGYMDTKNQAAVQLEAAEKELSGLGLEMSEAEEAKSSLVEPGNISPASIDTKDAAFVNAKEFQAAKKQSLDTLVSSLNAAVCQTCHRPFEGVDAVKLEADKETAERAWQEANEIVKEKGKDLKQAHAVQQDYSDYLTELGKLEAWTSSIEKTGIEAEARKTDAEEVLSGLTAVTEKSLAEARAQLTEVQAVNAVIAANLEAAEWASMQKIAAEAALESVEILSPVSEDFMIEARQKENELRAEVDKIRESHAARSTEYNETYQRYEDLAVRISQAEQSNTEMAAASKRWSLLNSLIKYLRKNRDRFVEGVWDSLLSYATEFANMGSQGKIIAVSRSASGDFMFDEGEGPQNIIGASGIQKAMIGVGVRLALADALRIPADFMLLDEVTAGARDEISLAMTQALAASGLQIISVSHRQSDAAVADKVITIGE